MELKTVLKLQQQLVMTPQLQQAIRLLQLSRLELVDEVRKELDGNPILMEEDAEGPHKQRSADVNDPSSVARAQEEEFRKVESNRETETATKEVDWEKFLENRTLQQPSEGSKGPSGFDDLPPIEQNLTRSESLHDHLLWQLQLGDFTDVERRFAELVIGNLNDNGFLDLKGVERPDGTRTPDLTIEDLADESELHRDDAPLVLEMIQNLDPIGVAPDLRECLLIQAEAYGYEDIEIRIIREHMGNLEKHNYQAIAKDLKVSVEEVYEAAKEIQKLESRPARNFTDQDERSIGITPDVYVIKDGEEFVVVDNDRGIQRLHINEALTKKLMQDPAAKEFVGEKLKNAQWLIRAIEQRRKTIIRVTECIVDKQRDFERGVAFLKPMILRDIADVLNMHESTISRVTTNKYMHTPQGLFELKYFFNSKIKRVAEEDIASESVKQAIKKLIDEEDKKNPLSDQAIVKCLEDDSGIKIARRTVAKYREMLGDFVFVQAQEVVLVLERVSMNISITFRHVESTDAIKAHANDKVAKLQKFLRQPMTAKVTLSVETHEQVAEVRVSSGSEHFEAKESSQDMYQAIDKVIHKLERQIQHSKGAQEAKRRRHDEAEHDPEYSIPNADDIAG